MGVMGDWFSAECPGSVISFAKKKVTLQIHTRPQRNNNKHQTSVTCQFLTNFGSNHFGSSHFLSRWRCFRAFTCLLCFSCAHGAQPATIVLELAEIEIGQVEQMVFALFLLSLFLFFVFTFLSFLVLTHLSLHFVFVLFLFSSLQTPAASGPPGVHTTTRRTPNVHISGPRRFKHHQIPRKDPREKEERKLWQHPKIAQNEIGRSRSRSSRRWLLGQRSQPPFPNCHTWVFALVHLDPRLCPQSFCEKCVNSASVHLRQPEGLTTTSC